MSSRQRRFHHCRQFGSATKSRFDAARLWLDGGVIAEKANFTKPTPEGHVFKVGRAAPDFGGDFKNGKINAVRVWKRALPDAEMALLFKNEGAGANTPDFTHD